MLDLGKNIITMMGGEMLIDLSVYGKFIHTDLLNISEFKLKTGKTINILNRITVGYDDFGTKLLNDTDGNKMAVIKNDTLGNAAKIKRKIIEEWIRGGGRRPVSWKTLATVIEIMEYVDLAKDIREGAPYQV